ncbi:unnamed protein product [Pedinophyceae sp. YPF-701]|nr:unnamed protein product [Pedinophyceae sp. YPF-701]
MASSGLASQAAAGSSLLQGLYKGMERMSQVQFAKKALRKRAQARTLLDIQHLMKQTEDVSLLTKNGAAVHRDLCHVLKLRTLEQGDTWNIDGCVFGWMMTGSVRIVTDEYAPLEKAYTEKPGASRRSQAEDVSSKGGVSVNELRALFDSIDADGSGAIDGEELQTALEMMGIHLSDENVAELMEGVDDDGSGELEFEEFVEIMTTKLKVGTAPERRWELIEEPGAELEELLAGVKFEGRWLRDFLEQHSFGGRSVVDKLPYQCRVKALTDCDIVVIDAALFEKILTEGFDGELRAKMDAMSAMGPLKPCMELSDKRSIAFAAVRVEIAAKDAIHEQNADANKVWFIEHGTADVLFRVTDTPLVDSNAQRSKAAVLREDLLTSKPRSKAVTVARLLPGDMCGEEAVIGAARFSHSVVAVSDVVAYVLDKDAIRRVLHPEDYKRLVDHCLVVGKWRAAQLAKAVAAQEAASAEAKGVLNTARRTLKQVNRQRERMGLGATNLSQLGPAMKELVLASTGGGGGGPAEEPPRQDMLGAMAWTMRKKTYFHAGQAEGAGFDGQVLRSAYHGVGKVVHSALTQLGHKKDVESEASLAKLQRDTATPESSTRDLDVSRLLPGRGQLASAARPRSRAGSEWSDVSGMTEEKLPLLFFRRAEATAPGKFSLSKTDRMRLEGIVPDDTTHTAPGGARLDVTQSIAQGSLAAVAPHEGCIVNPSGDLEQQQALLDGALAMVWELYPRTKHGNAGQSRPAKPVSPMVSQRAQRKATSRAPAGLSTTPMPALGGSSHRGGTRTPRTAPGGDRQGGAYVTPRGVGLYAGADGRLTPQPGGTPPPAAAGAQASEVRTVVGPGARVGRTAGGSRGGTAMRGLASQQPVVAAVVPSSPGKGQRGEGQGAQPQHLSVRASTVSHVPSPRVFTTSLAEAMGGLDDPQDPSFEGGGLSQQQPPRGASSREESRGSPIAAPHTAPAGADRGRSGSPRGSSSSDSEGGEFDFQFDSRPDDASRLPPHAEEQGALSASMASGAAPPRSPDSPGRRRRQRTAVAALEASSADLTPEPSAALHPEPSLAEPDVHSSAVAHPADRESMRRASDLSSMHRRGSQGADSAGQPPVAPTPEQLLGSDAGSGYASTDLPAGEFLSARGSMDEHLASAMRSSARSSAAESSQQVRWDRSMSQGGESSRDSPGRGGKRRVSFGGFLEAHREDPDVSAAGASSRGRRASHSGHAETQIPQAWYLGASRAKTALELSMSAGRRSRTSGGAQSEEMSMTQRMRSRLKAYGSSMRGQRWQQMYGEAPGAYEGGEGLETVERALALCGNEGVAPGKRLFSGKKKGGSPRSGQASPGQLARQLSMNYAEEQRRATMEKVRARERRKERRERESGKRRPRRASNQRLAELAQPKRSSQSEFEEKQEYRALVNSRSSSRGRGPRPESPDDSQRRRSTLGIMGASRKNLLPSSDLTARKRLEKYVATGELRPPEPGMAVLGDDDPAGMEDEGRQQVWRPKMPVRSHLHEPTAASRGAVTGRHRPHTRGLQAIARAMYSCGGSQYQALRAARKVLDQPLAASGDAMGQFKAGQLGVSGYTRALLVANGHIRPEDSMAKRRLGLAFSSGQSARPGSTKHVISKLLGSARASERESTAGESQRASRMSRPGTAQPRSPTAGEKVLGSDMEAKMAVLERMLSGATVGWEKGESGVVVWGGTVTPTVYGAIRGGDAEGKPLVDAVAARRKQLGTKVLDKSMVVPMSVWGVSHQGAEEDVAMRTLGTRTFNNGVQTRVVPTKVPKGRLIREQLEIAKLQRLRKEMLRQRAAIEALSKPKAAKT